MSKITGFSIASNGVEMAFKSPAILVHIEPNIFSPVLYFRKPSWLTEEQYRAVVSDIASQIHGLSENTVKLLEKTNA